MLHDFVKQGNSFVSSRQKGLSGKNFFDNVNEWIYCKGELKHYCAKHYAQSKACDRDKIKMSDSNNHSDEHAETDENDD